MDTHIQCFDLLCFTILIDYKGTLLCQVVCLSMCLNEDLLDSENNSEREGKDQLWG